MPIEREQRQKLTGSRDESLAGAGRRPALFLSQLPTKTAALAAALLLAAAPAWAHNFRVFATAEGAHVTGYGYYVGGGRPQGVTARAFTPDGKAVAEAPCDDQGAFSLTLAQPGDVVVVIDVGDGHRAEFALAATDSAEAPTAAAPETADLDARIERALARQLHPLRAQLDANAHAVTVHDVLGGLGVIFGLTGWGAWWSARKRKDDTP